MEVGTRQQIRLHMSDVAPVPHWDWEEQKGFLGLILAGGHWGDPLGGDPWERPSWGIPGNET
jgi:hypothetical protein